jgi:putative oxidoreductase
MDQGLSSFIAAIGRVLLSLMFIQSGWSKLNSMEGTLGYITSHGLPQPQAAYYIAVAIELGGGIAILLGLLTRLAAAALCVFCLVAAYFFHTPMSDMGQYVNFWKDVTIAGGFLVLVAYGAGAISVDQLLFGGRAAVRQTQPS